ncbi:MAG: hypothetical protein ACXAC7_02415 [Candidatus Hodarchaeales archaeon]|jgi:hypothetical protein
MVLRNIIIQTSDGLPLFGRSLVCHIGTFCADLSKDITFKDDTILKSGLLTALLTFNEAEKGKFHEMELTQSNIISYPTDELIALIEIGPDDDLEPLKNRLKVMVELFQENFGDSIKNFKGETDIFNSFEKNLEEKGLFEEGERFRKNCLNCKYSKKCAFRLTTGPFYKTILEKFDSIKEIGIIKKMILMMLGMPGMMKYGMPNKQT